MGLSRITTKGQVTLPVDLRRQAGIRTGDSVAFEMTRKGILIKPVRVVDMTDEKDWIRRVDAAQAEVARGRTTRHSSEKAFLKHLAQRAR